LDTLYFDNNATTFLDPKVVQRAHVLSEVQVANPSSQHRLGRVALRILEQAKSDILQLLDAPSDGIHSAQVILTSGGTEANNLVLFGRASSAAARHAASDDRTHPSLMVFVSGIEHPSVLEAASQLPRFPVLPVDQCGQIDLNQLEQWLTLDKGLVGLVSVMLGNNETGTIQNLAAIAEVCHRFDVPVHSDIVQAAGKIPFSMRESNIDVVTLSGHKLHGPVGIGALVVKHGIRLAPRTFGGGQQLDIRPGTESVAMADCLALALRLTHEARMAGDYDRLATLRNHFEESLVEAIPDIEIIAANHPRLPHTSNIAFHGLDRQALFMALDLAGVACSTGSACASGSGRPSHVLTAMNLPESAVKSSLRFSFSRFTSPEEVENGIDRVVSVVDRFRRNRSSR
jgi:cysteine desulfurase